MYSVVLSPWGQSGLRPKFWPRPQRFGLSLSLSLKHLVLASKIWPRPEPQPQTFSLGLASISLSYCVIGHFSGKNCVKSQNFINFSSNKSYVVNHNLVFSQLFLASALASTSRNWPRPWPRSSGLGLKVLASFNITGCLIAACEKYATENMPTTFTDRLLAGWPRSSDSSTRADDSATETHVSPTTNHRSANQHTEVLLVIEHSLQQHLGSGIVYSLI